MVGVPDTIGRKKAEELAKAHARQQWFTKRAIEQRKASEAQRKKRDQS